MFAGFKQFILRGNVVDLAIGVVIGASFGAVVTALVKDLITPLVAAIGGQPNFSNLSFTVRNSHFMYGDFLSTLLSFLINAFVIYFFVVIPVSRLFSGKPKVVTPTTKSCPECFSQIPKAATRCPFCTTKLKAD